MDYFILPEDWIASRDCFSEKVLPLPKSGHAFATDRSQMSDGAPPDNTIRVAISAATMKLNPLLFDAIARIAAGAKSQVRVSLFSRRGDRSSLFRIVAHRPRQIPRATVHPQSSHDRYMERLAQCDLFLSPFPYGSMTSIMDALPARYCPGYASMGWSRTRTRMRRSSPESICRLELTTQSIDEYVAAAIRLIDDQAWRVHCTEIVRNADLDKAFFRGDAGLFRKAIENLIWPPAR